MTFYAEAQDDAVEILTELGQLGAVRRNVITGGGPADPTGGTVTPTDYPALMAVFPVSMRDVDGTTIKQGDMQVIVAADGLAITPTTTDKVVTAAGDAYTITDPGEINPAGTPVIYDMRARG